MLRLSCVPETLPVMTAAVRDAVKNGKGEPFTVGLDVTGQSFSNVHKGLTDLYTAATETDFLTSVNIVPTVNEAVTLKNADLIPGLGYRTYNHVAMGGTFDRLHAGHKVLLTLSVLTSRERLRIGVTSASILMKKKYAELIEPFDVRRKRVFDFVNMIRPELTYDIVELTEPSGGVNKIADVDAMVVSLESKPSAETINAVRVEGGLKPMEIIIIEYVGNSPDLGSDFKLSSSALRAFEAAKKGTTNLKK